MSFNDLLCSPERAFPAYCLGKTLMSDLTRILDRVHDGDPVAADELFPLVYEELRNLAAHKMAREKPGQTLQATALVHEAWLRLAGSEQQQWFGSICFLQPRRSIGGHGQPRYYGADLGGRNGKCFIAAPRTEAVGRHRRRRICFL
jgi:hypothetical protein